MMLAALATRDYTEHHIKRLVEKFPQIDEFVPETVPAFAATTTLKFIQEDPDFKKYKYREPSQKPTNMDDEADDDEKKLLKYFRENPEEPEKWEPPTELGESSWVYARPFIATKDCLECHNTPDEAPKNMLKKYGDHGFGWEEGKVEAAQIVTVPMSEPEGFAISSIVDHRHDGSLHGIDPARAGPGVEDDRDPSRGPPLGNGGST